MENLLGENACNKSYVVCPTKETNSVLSKVSPPSPPLPQ